MSFAPENTELQFFKGLSENLVFCCLKTQIQANNLFLFAKPIPSMDRQIKESELGSGTDDVFCPQSKKSNKNTLPCWVGEILNSDVRENMFSGSIQ